MRDIHSCSDCFVGSPFPLLCRPPGWRHVGLVSFQSPCVPPQSVAPTARPPRALLGHQQVGEGVCRYGYTRRSCQLGFLSDHWFQSLESYVSFVKSHPGRSNAKFGSLKLHVVYDFANYTAVIHQSPCYLDAFHRVGPANTSTVLLWYIVPLRAAMD